MHELSHFFVLPWRDLIVLQVIITRFATQSVRVPCFPSALTRGGKQSAPLAKRTLTISRRRKTRHCRIFAVLRPMRNDNSWDTSGYISINSIPGARDSDYSLSPTQTSMSRNSKLTVNVTSKREIALKQSPNNECRMKGPNNRSQASRMAKHAFCVKRKTPQHAHTT
jgi:hypothetical protein